MANWTGGVLTKWGRELQAKVLAGTTKLELTRIKLGSGSETADQVDSMRDLYEPKASLGISSVAYEDNLCTVTGIIITQGIEAGFYAKEWGLFANDPEEGEILYMISLDNIPDWIPPGSTALTISASYAMTIAVENTDNITVNISPTGLVDVEMLNNIVGVAGRTKAYSVGQTVTAEGLQAMYYLRCITAGTTDSTSPIIGSNVQVGDHINDGSVVWEVVKAANLSELGFWSPYTEIELGRIAFSLALPPGYFLECEVAGKTGGKLNVDNPAEGERLEDGTVTWSVHKIGSVSDIPVATESANGLMSAADKAKMNSIYIDATGNIGTKSGRFGIRIDKRNSDPATRCEYIFDAKGMGPCGMDFTNGKFNYGDWGDLWFVKKNKPVMLKPDGTVDYILDANDYTKQEGGAASDVANTSYDGNAMASIPLVYVKRWEDGRYEYEVISETPFNDTYKAFAHTDANGQIKDYFFYSMFGGSGNAAKIRSLSGQSLARSLTAVQEIAGCTANGAGWYTHTWSQRELIRTLCLLMGCSTDLQSIFGNGNCRSASDASGMLATGTLKDKGQFYGYNTSGNQVKVFHIEKFWGDQWDRVAGVINDHGKIYVKMTPEGNGYRVTDVTGYEDTGLKAPAGLASYINGMHCDEHGMIPNLATGSGSTFYCDGYWANNGQFNYLLAGASAHHASALGGPFCFDVDGVPGSAAWDVGCGLSYV